MDVWGVTDSREMGANLRKYSNFGFKNTFKGDKKFCSQLYLIYF